MHQLNYQHLFYFWMVAREGSIVGASRALHLSSATISVQVRRLQEQYAQQLLARAGRTLSLTEVGRVVFRYADSIFSTGQELERYLEGRPTGGPLRLDVGVAPVLPKLVTWRLLEPTRHLDEPCHLVCHEASPEELIAELLLHQVDVILSDAPLGAGTATRVFNHPLGQSPVLIMGNAGLAARYAENFPQCLDGAPFLMPASGTAMRRSLDSWAGKLGVQPRIAAEFDDSALLKVAGGHGLGLFPVPEIVAEEVADQYRTVPVGKAEGVVEQFYAVSAERQIEHPAVEAIAAGARDLLGGEWQPLEDHQA